MPLTPAMAQYYDLKEQNKDAVLFFRMGDFYEMFDDDAIIANKVLGIAVTTRNKNAEKPTPLAGIPFHAKDKYLPLLVNAGYKVAIAEQVSDPKLKGIVRREIVRIVTPATIGLEGEGYEIGANSSIISISNGAEKYGLSILDLSENKWQTCEFDNFLDLQAEIYKLSPGEVILEKKLFSDLEIKEILEKKYKLNIYFFEEQNESYKNLTLHFGTTNLKGFGIENLKEAQRASNILLEYLKTNQKNNFSFLNQISVLDFQKYLKIDEATIKNLDLIYNFATASAKNGTLFGILDKTKTNMGKNFLYSAITKPLNNLEEIKKRQDFVEEFLNNKMLLDKIRLELSQISNTNSILNRIAINRTSPRDLVNLKNSLKSILNIIEIIKNEGSEKLKKIVAGY